MANPWFRLYAEFAHDPKVQMMPEVMQRRLVMLFCIRCLNGNVTETFQKRRETLHETLHETDETKCMFHDAEIAFQLRISDEEIRETKELFIARGFIDSDWNVLNWDKRQYVSDVSTARVKAHRERNKNTVKNETFQKRYETVTETPPDTDTDTDTDTEKSIPRNLLEISKKFLEHQSTQFPKLVKTSEAKVKAGARAIHDLIRLDGFDLETDIRPVLRWAVKDSFWATNLLSLGSIRKIGKGGQSKFCSIVAAMKREETGSTGNGLGHHKFQTVAEELAERGVGYVDFNKPEHLR